MHILGRDLQEGLADEVGVEVFGDRDAPAHVAGDGAEGRYGRRASWFKRVSLVKGEVPGQKTAQDREKHEQQDRYVQQHDPPPPPQLCPAGAALLTLPFLPRLLVLLCWLCTAGFALLALPCWPCPLDGFCPAGSAVLTLVC